MENRRHFLSFGRAFWRAVLAAVAFALISTVPLTALAQALPEEIAISSLPKGTQYAQASAVAAIIEKHTPMKGFAEPTKSHVSAMPLFQKKKLDFIFVSQAEMHLANRGSEYYKDVGPTPMRVAAAGVELMFDFFTSPKTGIKKIEDMAGRRVMWETATAGSFYWAGKYVLEYYKIRDKVISIPSPSAPDRANALKMRRIDAYACSTQFTAMEIIHSSVGLKMLDIPKDCADWVNKQYPPLYHAICPKGFNGGMVSRDVPVLAVSTALQTRANLEDHVVYAVLEAIYDHFDEFSKTHPSLKDMSLNRAVPLHAINPYHAGAIKFYKDRGVWTDKAEAMQQRLLNELGATR